MTISNDGNACGVIVDGVPLCSGGGGPPVPATVTVEDCDWDGTLRASFPNVTTIRVCGNGETSVAQIAPGVVNVYHPEASFVSHFNNNDGIGDCRLSSLTTAMRAVANPGVFGIGDWVAGTSHPTTRAALFSFTTGNPCSFENETTTIEVLVAGADDNFGAPIATHTTPALTVAGTPYDVTLNGIRIRVDDAGGPMTPDLTKFKARIRVDVDPSVVLPNSGRFSIRITHNNVGAVVFQQGPMFYDSEPNTASLAGGVTTIAETPGLVIVRHVSGVHYYTGGSGFTVDVTDIDYLNGDSYPTDEQLRIDMSSYGLPTLVGLVGPTHLTGWTNAWDNVDASYNNAACLLSALGNFCTVNSAAQITSRVSDWGLGASQNSAPSAICVNTLLANATRIFEDFRLEDVGADASARRLESNLAVTFDPTQDLNAYDDSLGLQYQCSRLIYPQTDFSGYLPVGSPDYSGSAGVRTWFRRFWHDGVSHPIGRFRLTDHSVTEADLAANNVMIDISLNGIAWYSLNSMYVGGPLLPGSGCRIDKDVYGLPGNAPDPENDQIAFSLGTGGFTGPGTGGGWGIYIRIRYGNGQTTKYIGAFEEVTWI